jgi:hypothetical protein
MVKYRVLTDYLHWLGIYKDHVVYKIDNKWRTNRVMNEHTRLYDSTSINDSYLMDRCIGMNSMWFQKIEEKTYEILEQNPTLVPNISKSIIKKVKRLSDGEIFGVGDKIILTLYEGTITGFEVFGTDDMMVRCGATYTSLGSAQRRKPILTTEDGKEVYKGEVIYVVNKYDGLHSSKYGISTEVVIDRINHDHYWYFNTLSLAEKFVEENKPQFSKKDMIDFADYYQQGYTGPEGYFPAYKLEKWLKNKQ